MATSQLGGMTGFATDRQKTKDNHYFKMVAYFENLSRYKIQGLGQITKIQDTRYKQIAYSAEVASATKAGPNNKFQYSNDFNFSCLPAGRNSLYLFFFGYYER